MIVCYLKIKLLFFKFSEAAIAGSVGFVYIR